MAVHEISGYKVEFRQVSIALVDEVNRKYKDPDPPMVDIEGKGKEYNPNDPNYIKELQEAGSLRAQKVVDTLIIMGTKLKDGLPKGDDWLEDLEFNFLMTGTPDLSKYDLDNDRIKEFVFKRFYLFGRSSYDILARETGVTEEEIEQAADTFPSDAERVPDRDGSPEARGKS